MTPDEPAHDPSDALRRAWQGQPAPAPPTLDDVRRRAQRFTRRISMRNAREFVAGAVVIPLFVAEIVRGGFNGLVDVGNVLIVAGCAYVLYRMHQWGRAQALPAELGMVDALSFHRAEVVRQRDLLTSVWRWYLLPFMPGMVVTLVGRAVERPALWNRALGTLVGALALAAFLAWLNRRAAGRLQRDIDALDRLASGRESSLAAPEPPSMVELLAVWVIVAFCLAAMPLLVAVALGVIAPPSPGEPLDVSTAPLLVRWWLPVATVVGVLTQAAWWWFRHRRERR
jgi:hypothetical protein